MWGRVLALGALEKAIEDGITGNADPDAYLRQWWDDLNAAWEREYKREADERYGTKPQHGKPKP
jgi:hypothetical protein